jgi:hypothetical protein
MTSSQSRTRAIDYLMKLQRAGELIELAWESLPETRDPRSVERSLLRIELLLGQYRGMLPLLETALAVLELRERRDYDGNL